MTAANTSVKYFHSSMTGAPTLNGAAGTLIAVLDACLVNGFGVKTIDTLVVASGIATATISAGIGAFEADAVILVSGATPSGLNGEKRIIAATTTTVTFDATGISNQTATGTITAKLAPAGWAKTYSGTNLAAYQSTDVASTRAFLRVDDTANQVARVVGYESMTDVNTGTGPFPTALQQSGGMYWLKANGAAGAARAWTVIADGKTVWFHAHTATTNPGVAGWVQGFGDFTSYKSGDAYACFLMGSSTDTSTSAASASDAAHVTSAQYVARAYTGLGSSVSESSASESYGMASYSGSSGTSSSANTYPNGADNALLFTRKVLYETGALRGILRGLLLTPQYAANSFNWRDKVDGAGAYAGRKLMAIKCSSPAQTTASVGLPFFDITGPW